jgi:type I restriction enzyme S subunit
MIIAPPPLPEQRRIVAYLDEKTSAIDRRISLLEKKQEAFKRLKKSVINCAVTRGLDPNAKLKDSGVDWIGKVPASWCVDKIGNCFYTIGSGTTPRTGSQDLYEGDIPWVQSGDLHGDCVAATSKQVSETALKCYSLPIYRAPFICVAMYGASIGNVSIIGMDACTNQACCALCKPRPGICLDYMFFLLRQSQQRLLLFAEGGTQPNINRGIIIGLRVGLPPLPEQRAIADYLDAECAKIDAAVANLDKQIDAYRRLKRSLIDEVVTGKRKVS